MGAILVFDLTKSKSFENVQKWLAELKDRTEPSITMMLVGNKSNLVELREIKQESIEHYAKKTAFSIFQLQQPLDTMLMRHLLSL